MQRPSRQIHPGYSGSAAVPYRIRNSVPHRHHSRKQESLPISSSETGRLIDSPRSRIIGEPELHKSKSVDHGGYVLSQWIQSDHLFLLDTSDTLQAVRLRYRVTSTEGSLKDRVLSRIRFKVEGFLDRHKKGQPYRNIYQYNG